MVSFASINTVVGPLLTVKLKKGATAPGGAWVVFELVELDATEDAVALEDETMPVVEALDVATALVELEAFVPFGTANPTAPPMTITTTTTTANTVVLRPARPLLGNTIVA
jgi:hypothetical protein